MAGGEREVHGAGRQGLEAYRVYAGQIGAIAQPVDCALHFVRGARRFFFQSHVSVAAEKGGFLSRAVNTVVFSHGKESGPWGSKITAMAAVVRDLNLTVESVDYRGLDDPAQRVEKLLGVGRELHGPLRAGRLQHGRPCRRRRGRSQQSGRVIPAGAGLLHARPGTIHAARRDGADRHRARLAR